MNGDPARHSPRCCRPTPVRPQQASGVPGRVITVHDLTLMTVSQIDEWWNL